jgi:hypothetical protein
VTNYAVTHIRRLLSRFRERIVATALERNSNQETVISPAKAEDEMFAAKCPAKMLKGLSLDIPDLILIHDRSMANDLRMVVQLDYSSDVEEYEEVLAFYSGTNPQWRWMMWRNASAVFVRSIDARSRRYRSAAQAIEALVRKEQVVLTDIEATHWPSASSGTVAARSMAPVAKPTRPVTASKTKI